MRITYTKHFIKNYRQRIHPNSQLKVRFGKRVNLFTQDRTHPFLRDHKLIGKKQQFRSFSITGDIRIIYREISTEHMLFIDIGSHTQVYGV